MVNQLKFASAPRAIRTPAQEHGTRAHLYSAMGTET